MAMLVMPSLWAVLRTTVLAALLVYILAAVVLFLIQRSMLYHPRSATRDDLLRRLPWPGEAIAYSLAPQTETTQTAMWLPPRNGQTPTLIWLIIAGNASLATDLVGVAEGVHEPGTGFLFVDYPGFGPNPGSPSPATTLCGTQGAVAALVARWSWTADDCRKRIAVLGHSMGAAVALQHAAVAGAHRVVLVAPFTSLLAMSQRAVGWPLCQVLVHRFDNAARLDELLAQPEAPPVVIVHGERDQVIPQAMGKSLADAHPGRVQFIPVPGADHDGVVYHHLPLLWSVMTDAPVH